MKLIAEFDPESVERACGRHRFGRARCGAAGDDVIASGKGGIADRSDDRRYGRDTGGRPRGDGCLVDAYHGRSGGKEGCRVGDRILGGICWFPAHLVLVYLPPIRLGRRLAEGRIGPVRDREPCLVLPQARIQELLTCRNGAREHRRGADESRDRERDE